MIKWLKNGGSIALPTLALIVGMLAVPFFLRENPDNAGAVGEKRVIEQAQAMSPEEVAATGTQLRAECSGTDEPTCLQKNILDVIPDHGPEPALNLLSWLLSNGANLGSGDHHDFVHKIGRATAKAFGVNADAFFACPVTFNYGCPHGFFEQALVEAPDAKQAALNVCDPERMKDKPRKFFFYCYHGVGHGVMMAKAYDVRASLDVCNNFPEMAQQEGCWQGVFMENTNGYNTSNMRSDSFSQDDLLYPCNTLDEKYAWQCYLNHAGYMINRLGGNGHADQISAACLDAKEPGRSACIQGLGLMATNIDWQKRLVKEDTGDLITNAVSVCSDFPDGYRDQCVMAGVDNLANFDRTNTTNMVAFCSAVPEEFRRICFHEIGRSITNEVLPTDDGSHICDGIPEQYLLDCQSGAGKASTPIAQ